MFKIGEFSRFSHVTVKTLRYYDKIGLLEPAEIDPFTGYRYYSARQLPRLNRILALKDMGLSLEQIGQLLEGDLTPDQMRGMLRLKQAELQGQLEEEQARLARVERRLKRIEQEKEMPTHEVVVRKVSAQTVAAVRDTMPEYSGYGQLLGEVFGHLGQHQLAPAGPPVGIYYDEEHREKDVDIEAAVPVGGEVPDGARVKGRELPAVEHMACIIHEGAFDDAFQGVYDHLLTWIEENGYQMAGPCREVYVQWDASGDPSGNITEIQIPVEKA